MNFIIPGTTSPNPIPTPIPIQKPSPSSNITDYTKICENIYRFTSNSVNNDNNIYILYNNACETKHVDSQKAMQMFKRCEELIDGNTSNNTIYEIYVNLALLSTEYDIVSKYYTKAIMTISDRAEPYYYWSLFCNKNNRFDVSYVLLRHAINISYEQAKYKYVYVQRTAYDKYLFEELATVCLKTKLHDECKYYLEQLINDNEFSHRKDYFRQILDSINETNETNEIIEV